MDRLSLLLKQSGLRLKLSSLLSELAASPPQLNRTSDRNVARHRDLSKWGEGALEAADVVITPNEVNYRHGTGALIATIFGNGDNILSLRSFDHYEGEHTFPNPSIRLAHPGLSRPEAFQRLLRALGGIRVRRIFCVPYFSDEVLSALALKELHGASLVTYIMDDQNIHEAKIADSLMRECLTKSSLRLAISPEMRDAYEDKYGLKFWLLPPVVAARLVLSGTEVSTDAKRVSGKGVLVGNVWSKQWSTWMRDAVRDSGCRLDWYGGRRWTWAEASNAELEQDGITACGIVSEERLAEHLQKYPYAVVPSGTLDEDDDRKELAQLSLPSRIIFLCAAANIPIVVIGSPDTAAARFVKRFGIGVNCDYDARSYRQAVKQITEPSVQRSIRDKAAAVGKSFSAEGLREWLWRSLEQGKPSDLRFESLLPRSQGDLATFIEPPVPSDVYWPFVPVYEVMRRLRLQGLEPNFVVDVGSSSGVWSSVANKLFPDARFVLIDPVMSRYDENARRYWLRDIRRVDCLEIAVSDRAGRRSLQVPPDLYGSSLLRPADFRSYLSVDIKVTTLDHVAAQYKVEGRGILKIDAQCAEHLVLRGATHFVSQVDVLVAELSLVRYEPEAKTLTEMVQLVEKLGFRIYDEAGSWRSPVDGTLLQKDLIFVRNDLFVPETGQG